MKLKIPKELNNQFSVDLFRALSEGLNELRAETGKWPDSIIISGPLGREVHDFILSQGWKLDQFGIRYAGGIVNKIRLEYSKPLDEIKEVGGTIFDKPIGEIEISGIPSKKMVDTIVSTYSNFSYTIKRTIRPNMEIILIRK